MKVKFDPCSPEREAYLYMTSYDFTVQNKINFLDDGEHEVIFTIDGVEVDFVKAYLHLAQYFKGRTAEEAKKLFESRMGELISPIEDRLIKLKEEMDDLCRESFPEAYWDDD